MLAYTMPKGARVALYCLAACSSWSPSPGAEPPFVDATSRTSVEFRHFNGESSKWLLPEITGGGAALLDFDRDGDLDLYLVQGGTIENEADGVYKDLLFGNDEPTFIDFTRDSGISATGYGMGAAAGDFDSDGWVDLYVTNLGPNQLWRNNGDGTFDDIAVTAAVDDPGWSTSATFFDFDRDGHLDLFVARYADFAARGEVECYAPTGARDYCGPDAYEPVSDRLYRNLGNGEFADVTRSAGLAEARGAGLGVVAADLNDDGWTDLYVANDGDPNFLWINQGDGTFVDDALLAGVSLNASGEAEAGMGVDLGDVDGDGDDDLFVTHLRGETNTLYVNDGDGLFEDQTIQRGLGAASLPHTGFGTRFVDYDNDGWLDIVVLNGAVRSQQAQLRQGDRYPLSQRNQLYRNLGDGKFRDVTDSAGEAFETAEVSRGLAAGDLDNDGDTDLVIVNSNGPARVLLNEVGSQSNWFGLDVAEGVVIEAKLPSGRKLVRRAHRDGSYLSSSDPRILLGLGAEELVTLLRVRWLDGEVEEWRDLSAGSYWRVEKGEPPTRIRH